MSAKWLWLMLGLTACVDPDAPNGKQGALFFRVESADPVAVGLEANLTLPGETPRSTFNFADTTLEVEASPGVSVVDKRQVTLFEGALSHQLTYRCESAGSRELRVRVLDRNKGPRYSDAFDVTCATPANLGQDYVELGVQHRPGSGWSASADARHIPTAHRVGGLEPCTWDVRFASGTASEEQGKCHRTIPDTLGAGTVCVSSHGHRTCADFPSR
ncbi:hypothetical protein [Archangium sp.]|uniref:hypothetical protein n=1 Tax=Archangium sp. TaxID=1872627 RepID=UPI002869F798|nr:hypothetical protein [Archangium sp.]